MLTISERLDYVVNLLRELSFEDITLKQYEVEPEQAFWPSNLQSHNSQREERSKYYVYLIVDTEGQHTRLSSPGGHPLGGSPSHHPPHHCLQTFWHV